jgi:hypothetical protein
VSAAGRSFLCHNSADANTNLALLWHSISAAANTDTDLATDTDIATTQIQIQIHIYIYILGAHRSD